MSGTCQVVPFHKTAELPFGPQRNPFAQRQMELRRLCGRFSARIKRVAYVVRDAIRALQQQEHLHCSQVRLQLKALQLCQNRLLSSSAGPSILYLSLWVLLAPSMSNL